MKKNKIILLIIYLLIVILCLCGCSNNEDKDINKKIQSEIEYLDKKIIGIMNKLNNITLENYEVKSKEIISQSEGENNAQQGSSGGDSSQGGGSGGGSSSGGGSGGGSSSGGGSEQNNNQQDDTGIKVLQMEPSNILVINKDEIDWPTIKSEVEVMYSTWNSILLDLYSVNVENQDILNFSEILDNTVLLVKAEDKARSLIELANLYSFLPKYMDKLSVDESTKNILKTKANILNAYALVETANWAEIEKQINQADEAYSKVINDVQYIENKEQSGRVYVLIKELKNSIKIQDKDIFYIKYKNLMNSIT